MTSPAIELLEQARAALAHVADDSTVSLSDEELCAMTALTEDVGRLVDATRLATAAEIEERSRFELGSAGLSYRLGHRRSSHLVEQLTRVSQAEAARRVRVGSALRPRLGLGGEVLPAEFPHVAAAVAEGSVGVDAAAVVTRCLAQASHVAAPDDLEAAELGLVDEATRQPADNVGVMARQWREALDPDGALSREEKLRLKEKFVLGREKDGMLPFHGVATGSRAAELRSLLAPTMDPDPAPRFLSEEDLALGTETHTDDDGEAVSVFHDPRTRDQRNFDIFMGILRAGIRSESQRATANVLAVVTLDDLENNRGIGWIDGIDEPVSAASISEIVCDSGFRKVILTEDGEVLVLGRLERCFTYFQKLALAARDGGCVWPGCKEPPSRCHAHHVVEWAKGGLTDVDNGVLLCAAHHHMLHNSEFAMKMIDGLPHLRAPRWLDPTQDWVRVGKSRLKRPPARVAA